MSIVRVNFSLSQNFKQALRVQILTYIELPFNIYGGIYRNETILDRSSYATVTPLWRIFYDTSWAMTTPAENITGIIGVGCFGRDLYYI